MYILIWIFENSGEDGSGSGADGDWIKLHVFLFGAEYDMAAGFFAKGTEKVQNTALQKDCDRKNPYFYQLFRNSLYNFSTRLLLRGGVHYLTLSGLVKPVKWRFSGPCSFHQASSDCIVFVANGV